MSPIGEFKAWFERRGVTNHGYSDQAIMELIQRTERLENTLLKLLHSSPEMARHAFKRDLA